MFKTDFHIHSDCSPDAFDTMTDMASALKRRGITTACFTDHCDIDNYMTGEYDPGYLSAWTRMKEAYRKAVGEHPDMDIRIGIELGAANHYPDKAALAANTEGLDFIIASVHNNRGIPDFSVLDYESMEHCTRLNEDYLREYAEIAELDCFDVLGHIGYTTRYMLRAGYPARLTVREHGGVLEEIFKRLIKGGKGIELNCSGFRSPGIDMPIPSPEILKLYRELGGEIITIGSDAHNISQAGMYISEGLETIRNAGFSYVTIFSGRKPEFIKIADN